MTGQMLLIAQDAEVTCPGCQQAFSLEQGFARQALEGIESRSRTALSQLRAQERSAAERQAQQLSTEREQAARLQLEEQRRLIQQQSEDHAKALAQTRVITEAALRPQLQALERELSEGRIRLAAMDVRESAVKARELGLEQRVQEQAAARAVELLAAERGEFERRLADAQAQLQLLREEQLQLRSERSRLQDEKAGMALEVQRQVDFKCAAREGVVRTQEQERAHLREADLQKKLDDARTQLEDAQRRMAQGSQQLQGEVLELAIEDGLRRMFPLDAIEEVKKGVRGADVVQNISTRPGHAPIKVLWETKRAKDFSAPWIGKLKEDMRACGAEVGVLVTLGGAVPKEWEAGQMFSLHDGVYVVLWSVALQLGQLLREALLAVHRQRVVSASRDEKMAAVYDYVTSSQFAQKLRAVHEAFQRMREELESEKAQTLQRWARREKQLQGGLAALLGVGGEIQGLAQKSLPELELQPGMTD
jgi:hypothetical protein